MNQPLRAISVQQPWAWAIAHAGKNLENRTRPNRHRGLLAIHAPQRTRHDDIEVLRESGFAVPDELTISAVIAVATLIDTHSANRCGGTCSPWAEPGAGIWHWRLDNTTAITPVKCPGMRNLWTLPTDIANTVLAAYHSVSQSTDNP